MTAAIVNELREFTHSRKNDLIAVAEGRLDPPSYSRLGAFKATLGFGEGTVGRGANRAIAAIYLSLGTLGEDEIGTVFNSREVQVLLDDPADGPSSRRLAELEYAYWSGQETIGGYLGAAFPPTVRDAIQWAMSW